MQSTIQITSAGCLDDSHCLYPSTTAATCFHGVGASAWPADTAVVHTHCKAAPHRHGAATAWAPPAFVCLLAPRCAAVNADCAAGCEVRLSFSSVKVQLAVLSAAGWYWVCYCELLAIRVAHTAQPLIWQGGPEKAHHGLLASQAWQTILMVQQWLQPQQSICYRWPTFMHVVMSR